MYLKRFSASIIFSLNIFLALGAAEARDGSGTYDCECSSRHCSESDTFRLSYDRETLRIELEGQNWLYEATVTRQESKTTGEVFLILPPGFSVMSAGATIRARPDGSLTVDGEPLTCNSR